MEMMRIVIVGREDWVRNDEAVKGYSGKCWKGHWVE